MTKQEIEQAIENGKSVWCVYKDQSNIYEIKAVEIEKVLNDTFLWGKEYYANIKDVYKTKAEAEHYLHHANVERVEKLPFLTWEEFKENKTFEFVNNEGVVYELCIGEEKLQDKILLYEGVMLFYTWDLTEANFYKAYDECKKLFLEAEDE